MAGLSVKISMDAAGYQQGLSKASESTKEYTNQVSKITQSLPNLRKEMAQAVKETNNLQLAVSRLTEEQRNSAEGKAMIQMLQETKARAAELKDMFGDTATEIRNMASDTRTLDVINDAFSVIGNSVTAVAGAIGLSKGAQEDLNKAIAAFTTVQSVSNALTALQNTLQKQSALMLAISAAKQKALTLATKLDTAAKSKNIIASKAATVAQKALNLVAKANPYVLLATAIAGVTAALFAFSGEAEEAKDNMGKLEDGSNDLSTALGRQAEYNDELKSKTAELVGNYDTLRIQWIACGNEADKQQKFLKSLGDNFFVLGTRVNDSTSAMQMFVEKAPEVRKAYMYIASIEAAQNVYKKMMEQSLSGLLQNMPTFNSANQNTTFKAAFNSNGGMILPEELKEAGLTEKDVQLSYTSATSGVFKLLTSGINKYNSYYKEKSKNEVERLAQVFNKTQEAATGYLEDFIQAQMKSFDSLGLGSYQDYLAAQKEKAPKAPKAPKVTKTKEPKVEKPKLQAKKVENVRKNVEKKLTELQELYKQRDELIKYLNRKDLTEYERDDKEIELKELEDKIKNIESWTKDKKYVLDMPNGSIILEFEGAFEIDKDEVIKEYEKQLNDINFAESKPLDIRTRFTITEWQDFENKRNISESSQAGISQVQDWFDAGLLGEEKAQELIDAFNAKMRMEGLEPIEVNLKLNKLHSQISEAASIVGTLGNSIAGVFDAFNALQKGEDGDDKGMMIGKLIAQTVATLALSFAEAMKSASKNWVTWLAFGLTGMAQLISMTAQIKNLSAGSYASGGIIPGGKVTGDQLIVSANSKEMILNQRQQNNLFRAIDQNKLGGSSNRLYGNITVKGSDLKIALSNEDKIHRKSR